MNETQNDANSIILSSAADTLFAYLRDVIYSPANAALDFAKLPEEFQKLGKGLVFYCGLVQEMTGLAKELAGGNLNCKLPSPSNEIAAPLKMLHSSLKHLTWQTQQVAKGDYHQRVAFMGEFSTAFNNMISLLEQRQITSQNEMSRLEMYMDLLLANSPDPILIFDKEGRLAFAGESYLKHSGVKDTAEVLGSKVRDMFGPWATEGFISTMEHLCAVALDSKVASQAELEVDLGGTGTPRNYRVQVTPMQDVNGGNGGVIVLFADITESVKARRDAEEAMKLAEGSSRAKSEFLSRMSHELRTPMNAIIGMTAILESTEDPERFKYCVDRINEASRHMTGVINDILDMSSIESGDFDLVTGRFDLRLMVDRQTSVIAFAAREKEQRLTVTLDPCLPTVVVADERRLSQVLTNLLSNAVKFTQNGGDISLTMEVASESDRGYVIAVAVRDSGAGISVEQQKQLFKPFNQVDGGFSRKHGGTGLGLAICKRIVEMMGGRIWVESAQNAGSAFFLEIPVDKAGDEAGDIRVDMGTEGIFTGRRGLLVDDVEINREILIAILEDTGITIDQAADGIDALERYAASPDGYDIVFMDIHMPHMDGFEATRRLRASGLPRADVVPVVAITANAFQSDIDNCLAAGMNSHLGKPLDAPEVLARVKEFLL